MKTVLVDASSAILLHKVSLLETMYRLYRFAMVTAVIEEITVANHPGAVAFQTAVAKKRIHHIPMFTKLGDGGFSKRLGAGERHTLLAYGQSQACFILIDDKQGVRACSKRNIPFINALLCPEILFRAGCLKRHQRDVLFKRLLSIGRYAPAVAAYADGCSWEELAHFLPDGTPRNRIHI